MKPNSTIPKIIHLTWFSGNDFPKKLEQCINTWKKLLPDYEIKLWTMEMARSLNIQYINEALDAQKWAFASDVVRAYAVWKYGGVYMDTDIYLLRRFDELMTQKMVFFMEVNTAEWKAFPKECFLKDGKCNDSQCFVLGRQIQAAMFMAQPNQQCLEDIVEFYRHRNFLDPKGNSMINIISPSIYAKVLENYGFVYIDKEQHLKDNITIFPSTYVAYSPYETFSNTISIHFANHSWNPRSLWGKFKYYVRMTRLGAFLNKLRYYRSNSKQIGLLNANSQKAS